MTLSPLLKQVIEQHCRVSIDRIETVSGGDINRAYAVFCGKEKFFLKIHPSSDKPDILQKEAEGLKALQALNVIQVPTIIHQGITEHKPYLLMEWIERGVPQPNFWEEFGRNLASMHRKEQNQFGWETDNYIGSLKQVNKKTPDWASFYAEYRILPLVRLLHEKNIFDKKIVDRAYQLCQRLEQIIPSETPALLHGDLWSGNFSIAANGEAVIFDPAVYCGHREMDLGMTLLFGGFDKRFYQAYQECYPLEKNWEERIPLTQLYPILVHACLFGGSYIRQVISIIQRH